VAKPDAFTPVMGRTRGKVTANQVTIRRARPDEKTTLESLQWRASLANAGDRDALLANPDAIVLPIEQIAAGGVFVAEHDGVIVGFAAVLPRPDGEAELDALFVEPHLWKAGVGRRLVNHAAELARASGAAFLHVIGNPHAEGFYVSCDFRVSGTSETRFGAGLTMRRRLSDERPTSESDVR
jgi:GNAT superfamily N-acetyltransferase